VFVCFLTFLLRKAIISLYHIKLFVFVMWSGCVYWEVGTEVSDTVYVACTNPRCLLLNFVRWRRVFVGLQCGPCFMSHFWRLEFWVGSWFLEYLCILGLEEIRAPVTYSGFSPGSSWLGSLYTLKILLCAITWCQTRDCGVWQLLVRDLNEPLSDLKNSNALLCSGTLSVIISTEYY
jgi:hypothetical protein